MRGCRRPGLNKLRECYPNSKSLGMVINRSSDYVLDRLLKKREFTEREMQMILADLGEGYTEDIFK